MLKHLYCQRQYYILNKVMKFHCEHIMPVVEAQATLAAAVKQIPSNERAAEATLAAELELAYRKRGRGPHLLGELLPAVLASLGVNLVESSSSGEVDPR